MPRCEKRAGSPSPLHAIGSRSCPLVVDTVPKISQDEAQNNALRAFDMGAGAITQSKLAVIPLADSQKLVWIIDTVELDKENFSHGGRVIVDAVSGTVISTNPLQ